MENSLQQATVTLRLLVDMFLPIVAMAILGQSQDSIFQNTFQIVEPERLAITPSLDGKKEAEEWEALSGDSYFQWEPDRLYFATQISEGKDAVLSLDLKCNGWLIGKDNIEVRLSVVEGRVTAKIRTLDGTIPSGPQWREMPELSRSSRFVASRGENGWFVEGALVDPGDESLPADEGSKMGIRMDVLASGAGAESYLPRSLGQVNLVFQRGSNVPAGLVWGTEMDGRSVAAGSKYRIRMTFRGGKDLGLKSIGMRTEGSDRDNSLSFERPFPKFDNKNRSIVDYQTDIASEAKHGYRVARAIIEDSAGHTTTLKVSYFVTNALTFDLVQPAKVGVNKAKLKLARFSVYLRSNTTDRLRGKFRVIAPDGMEVHTGNNSDIAIGIARATLRKVFELKLADGHPTMFPLTLEADLGARKFTQTFWVNLKE